MPLDRYYRQGLGMLDGGNAARGALTFLAGVAVGYWIAQRMNKPRAYQAF